MDVGEVRARLTVDMRNWDTSLSRARTGLEQTGRSARSISKDVDKLSSVFLGVGGAVAIGLGSSIKSAADFEKKLSGIKSVSGATGDEMAKLSDLAKKAGQDTVYSSSQAADAISELLKSGLSVQQVLDGGLTGALSLASAGEIDLADAATIASTALNSFKDDQLSVSQAADILAGAANSSASDISSLKFGLSAVSAVASGAGMSFRDTATALAVFSSNGLVGSDAGTSLKTMLMNLVPSGKRARETMHELGIAMADGSNKFYDANGKLKSLAEVSDVLRNALIKLNPKERGEALKDMFGSDAVRAGTILFKEGAKGVEAMATAMGKITAAETAKTKLDNFEGSVEALKGSLETLSITVGEEFLPMLTDFAKEINNVVSSMDDVDMANLKSGLSFAGVASAIGLTGTSLAKLGLAARALFLAMGGPVTLTIGALALLGGAIAATVVKNKEMEKARLSNIEKGFDEVKSIDESIKAYDRLQSKSRLTNDEFGKYIDNLETLKTATDPKVIDDLTRAQDELQKKSGLSNKELSEMVDLNGKLIEKVPEATGKITEQGNKIIETTNKLKELNNEKLQSLFDDLESQRVEKETEYKNLLEKEKDLIKERQTEETKLQSLVSARKDALSSVRDEEKILSDMQSGKISATEIELQQQRTKIKQARDDLGLAQNRIDKQRELIQGTDKELDSTRKKEQKIEEINQRMAQIILKQAGLNSEKGKELGVIDSAIGKLQKQRAELEKSVSPAQRNTTEFREARDAIDQQIGKLQTARNKVGEIYNAAKNMNAELGKDISKSVTVTTYNRTIASNNYNNAKANALKYHTGGIVGQPPKLHTGGPAWSVAPNHNEVDARLLRNEMVLTEAQQSNLMRMIDAGNTNKAVVPGTDPALVSAIKDLASRPVSVEIDGKAVASATYQHVDSKMAASTRMNNRITGMKR